MRGTLGVHTARDRHTLHFQHITCVCHAADVPACHATPCTAPMAQPVLQAVMHVTPPSPLDLQYGEPNEFMQHVLVSLQQGSAVQSDIQAASLGLKRFIEQHQGQYKPALQQLDQQLSATAAAAPTAVAGEVWVRWRD